MPRANVRPQVFNIAAVLLICPLLALFVAGGLHQAKSVNTDMTAADQSAYMRDAKNLRTSRFQHVTDRNRMPVYSGLMALLYRDGMTDEEFFAVGKKAGIVIAVAVLLVTYLILLRVANSFDAFVALVVSAFTVLVYKCAYFQPEVLFYGLTLCLFVLLVELVTKPRIPIAAAAGLIGAIAHLTKASVLPGLMICLFCLVVHLAMDLIRKAKHHGTPRREVVRPLLCAAAGTGIFLFVVFPYIRMSKLRFGHYFYNVNSTFYMWYDSWDDAVAGTRAYGDRKGWPDMPPDQIPSLRKYLREHSAKQIVMRFVNGADTMRKAIIKSSGYTPFGYASFLLLYLCFVLLVVIQNRRLCGDLLRDKSLAIRLFFIVSYFTVYLALYAWYTPIASGNRFFLALFLPAIFSFAWLISYATEQGLHFSVRGRHVSASSVAPLILIALLAHLLLIFPDQISTIRMR